ncbi:MAG: hypothetical protein HC860_12965 [Alkalinema sp. RU_4_3]|nr:hypothetical protein [Alkalinema sp. RU_4_3]
MVKRLALGLVCIGGLVLAPRAMAQPLANCQPPGAEEFLLLVLGRTADDQARTIAAVPAGSVATVCNYQGDTVVRVNGFTTFETANAWAQFFSTKVGVQTFVARPGGPATPFPTAPVTPPVVPTAPASPSIPNITGYNPQVLGQGYAVLVNYYNRPEVAAQLQQTLGKPVGLVSFGQRPYLLVTYTTDQNTATALLSQLSNQGYGVSLVDGRRVVLVKSEVAR